MVDPPAEPLNPVARRWLIALLLVFALVKILHFSLATEAVHAGIIDPQFASGYPLVAWDSLHYLQITQEGYPKASGGAFPETIGFFPLLPLMTRPVAMLMDPPIAMLLVCNAASLAGLLWFFGWCRRALGAALAFWACVLLLAYPPAMFFSAAYTEPVFFATTAAALYFAQRKRPWLAALAAGIGAAVRPTGVVVSLVIWIDAILQTPGPQRLRSSARFIAIGILSIAGLLAHACYLTYEYGTPLAYIHAQNQLVTGADSSAPASAAEGMRAVPAFVPVEPRPERVAGRVLAKITSIGAWGTLLAWGTLIVSILILIPRLPWPRHILMLPLLIFLIGFVPNMKRINSCSRFMACALPIFAAIMALPVIRRRPWLLVPAMVGGFAIGGLYAWGFTRGVWAG